MLHILTLYDTVYIIQYVLYAEYNMPYFISLLMPISKHVIAYHIVWCYLILHIMLSWALASESKWKTNPYIYICIYIFLGGLVVIKFQRTNTPTSPFDMKSLNQNTKIIQQNSQIVFFFLTNPNCTETKIKS